MGAAVSGWAEAQSAGGTRQSGGKTAPWTVVEFPTSPRLLPPPACRPESPVFGLTCAGFPHVVAAAVVVAAVAACGSCPHTAEVSAGSTPDPE